MTFKDPSASCGQWANTVDGSAASQVVEEEGRHFSCSAVRLPDGAWFYLVSEWLDHRSGHSHSHASGHVSSLAQAQEYCDAAIAIALSDHSALPLVVRNRGCAAAIL